MLDLFQDPSSPEYNIPSGSRPRVYSPSSGFKAVHVEFENAAEEFVVDVLTAQAGIIGVKDIAADVEIYITNDPLYELVLDKATIEPQTQEVNGELVKVENPNIEWNRAHNADLTNHLAVAEADAGKVSRPVDLNAATAIKLVAGGACTVTVTLQ